MIELILTAAALTVIAGASLAMYLLPLIIGMLRRVPDIGSVAVINVLLGWTLIGWAAAMAMALRTTATGGPTVQIIQHLPAGRPLPALPAGDWSGLHDGTAPRPEPPPLVLPPHPPGSWAPDDGGYPGRLDTGGFGDPTVAWDGGDRRDPGGFGDPDGWSTGDGSGDPGGFGDFADRWGAGDQREPGGYAAPDVGWDADGPRAPGGSAEKAGGWSADGSPDPAGFGDPDGRWNADSPWAPGGAWDPPSGGERR